MKILGLGLILALAGCSTVGTAVDAEQQAITSCRDAGFISAVKDAGAWYCYKDRLPVPPLILKPTPKATP